MGLRDTFGFAVTYINLGPIKINLREYLVTHQLFVTLKTQACFKSTGSCIDKSMFFSNQVERAELTLEREKLNDSINDIEKTNN